MKRDKGVGGVCEQWCGMTLAELRKLENFGQR